MTKAMHHSGELYGEVQSAILIYNIFACSGWLLKRMRPELAAINCGHILTPDVP